MASSRTGRGRRGRKDVLPGVGQHARGGQPETAVKFSPWCLPSLPLALLSLPRPAPCALPLPGPLLSGRTVSNKLLHPQVCPPSPPAGEGRGAGAGQGGGRAPVRASLRRGLPARARGRRRQPRWSWGPGPGRAGRRARGLGSVRPWRGHAHLGSGGGARPAGPRGEEPRAPPPPGGEAGARGGAVTARPRPAHGPRPFPHPTVPAGAAQWKPRPSSLVSRQAS